MESAAQAHLVKRRILKWLWGVRHEAGASEPGWSTFRRERWGCGVWLLGQSAHHFTQTDAAHQFIIHLCQESVCESDTCLMRRRCEAGVFSIGYIMEPVHQAAAVRITVLLPSAAIGRKTLCRRLSPLLIGPACLTGRRRAAPCAWKKKKEKKRKKNSSRSEYQSERSSGDRKRKRKPRSGRT